MGRIIGIQYLRALAALLVVLIHAGDFFKINGHSFPLGRFGVDLFFVVSGFVMVTSTPDQMGTGQFILRRVIRVVPIYWLATLLGSVYTLRHGLEVGVLVPLADFLRSLFFVPFVNEQARGFVMPIVEVGWTLNLEMLFYLLFALSLWLRPGIRIWAILAVLVSIVAFAAMVGGKLPAIGFYAKSIVFEFVAGMAIASVYMQGKVPANWVLLPVSLSLIIPVMVIWPDPTGIRLIDYGIAASVILYTTLACENWLRRAPSRLLLSLGDASYSLYLTHKLWLEFLFAASFKGLFPKHWLISWPVAVGGSILLGIISYRLIERPLTNALNGVRKRFSIEAKT